MVIFSRICVYVPDAAEALTFLWLSLAVYVYKKKLCTRCCRSTDVSMVIFSRICVNVPDGDKALMFLWLYMCMCVYVPDAAEALTFLWLSLAVYV